MWALTDDSTWEMRGHFGAGGWSARAYTTAVGDSGETADRRTDVGGRGIGGACRAARLEN